MRFHREHEQKNPVEIQRLLQHQTTALFVTFGAEKSPRFGVYNIVRAKDRFFLHIGRTDDQARDLDRDARCFLIFQDILSVVPSYWIDPLYGGAINNFFRFAQFECQASKIVDDERMKEFLQVMMDHYQPEKNYQPLDPRSDVYRDKFRQICLIELKPTAQKTKWNLGQTKPGVAFQNIKKQLRLRKAGSDLRTAEEMERWERLHSSEFQPHDGANEHHQEKQA